MTAFINNSKGVQHYAAGGENKRKKPPAKGTENKNTPKEQHHSIFLSWIGGKPL